MSAFDFQVIVIQDTYDIFDKSDEVQDVLSAVWAMKLKGYKNFFKYGVCPNDKYDFFSNHIIFTRKDDITKPLGGVKNITLGACQNLGIAFPPVMHMFGSEIKQKDYLHVYAINNWLSKFDPESVGYSMGYTMDPSLPKEFRKYLFDFVCYTFSPFYKENKIPNIIHGVNTLAKIDQKVEKIGFKDLMIDHLNMPLFKMEGLDDLDTRLMVSENYDIDVSGLCGVEDFERIWNNRIVLSSETLGLKKLAA